MRTTWSAFLQAGPLVDWKETDLYSLVVKIKLPPEYVDQYMKSIVENDAMGAVTNEPGCYRFDVMQDQEDPTTLYLYEVYKDKEAFDAHVQSSHMARHREATKNIPHESQATRCWVKFPSDEVYAKQSM
jgi:(4S)-4-hydroxy-5-phosphonooxypentane-2,3-dione isomerase